jgi:glycosyltransferase involved in cell wall biosynthesis
VVNGAPDELFAPRVTVVIPTYNYAEVLVYSIGSVLDQTFRDFELLVVGDGCTDNSERVATATGDPRVQWVNLPKNTGHQTGPNNEGLRRARGTFVAYLGHDDLWLPNHLEVLIAAFDAGVVAAHTTALRVSPRLPCRAEPSPGWSYTRGAWVAPTSMAIRRSRAVEVGGWRDARETGKLDPESDLLARLCDVAGPPRWIPRVTCVKLAAGERRGVYRTKPTNEQAYWLAQIRATDDPEGAIGAHVGRPYHLAGDLARDRAPVGLHERAWRSARYRLRKRLGLSTGFSARTSIRLDQRFKGSR